MSALLRPGNVVTLPVKARYELRRCTALVGDLQAGRLMRWIASWHRKATPKNGVEGLWNANPREAICAGVGITWKQYRRAQAILTRLGAADFAVHWYAGKRMVFTRPTAAFFVRYGSGVKHWDDYEISEKGHDRGHDEGTIQGTIKGTIIPSCSSCSSRPLGPSIESDTDSENRDEEGSTVHRHASRAAAAPRRNARTRAREVPPDGGTALSGSDPAAHTDDWKYRIKRDYPSKCRVDPEFLRLAEEFLQRLLGSPRNTEAEITEAKRCRDRCAEIADAGDDNRDGQDNLAGWAARLRDDLDSLIDQTEEPSQ